jgi:hypothetical protein
MCCYSTAVQLKKTIRKEGKINKTHKERQKLKTGETNRTASDTKRKHRPIRMTCYENDFKMNETYRHAGMLMYISLLPYKQPTEFKEVGCQIHIMKEHAQQRVRWQALLISNAEISHSRTSYFRVRPRLRGLRQVLYLVNRL